MSRDSSRLYELKEKLPHTWGAFLGRFGRFTEIQALAIEPVLAGKNCMLVSATSSGKTEAALMPLIERLKSADSETILKPRTRKTPDSRLSTLDLIYIVPTRALTRDLARRLQQPLDQLAFRMNIKTGDEAAIDWRRPPNMLLTTPESLDSLLANRPRMLKDARAVVIDEIHLFDNTARGDQLRVLISRLRRLRRYAHSRGDSPTGETQFCALSATVDNPEEVAARYFSDPCVIKTEGRRSLDAELIEMNGPESLRSLFSTFQQRGVRKALAFCNTRSECEQMAQLFKQGTPFGSNVFVHHANLDARLRHQTERSFAEASAALCFATSTLELGIDIGDLDLVILIGAPDDTSAFLQRVGRGNRRAANSSVICFYRSPIEEALFRVLIRSAESGHMESSHYFFRPSVVAQQLCSYIKQVRLGEIIRNEAYEIFVTPEGEPLIEKSHYDQIIDHLISKDYFVELPGGSLRPGPVWQRLYEHREIYSNLRSAARESLEVIDEMTGRKLGEIEWGTSVANTFLFGGKSRRAMRTQGRKLIVRAAEEDSSPPAFRSKWRAMSPELAREVAAEMGLPRSVSLSEIAAVEDRRLVEDANSPAPFWVFHCAGDAYAYVLGDLLESLFGVKVREVNGFCFMLEGSLPSEPVRFDSEQVRLRLRRRWNKFESYYDMGRFQKELPMDVRRESVITAFDIESFVRDFSGRKLALIDQ